MVASAIRRYRSNASSVAGFSSAAAATGLKLTASTNPTAAIRAALNLQNGSTVQSYRGFLLRSAFGFSVQHFDHLVVEGLSFFAAVPDRRQAERPLFADAVHHV